LRATEDALRKQKEKIMEIENETAGIRANILQEQEKNEKLVQQHSKEEHEKTFLLHQIDTTKQQLDQLHKKYADYKKTLEKTEEQRDKAIKEGKTIDREKQVVEVQALRLADEIKKIEDQNLQLLSEQKTFKKGSESAYQE